MFEKYSKYRDPQIEWLGDIPQNWKVARLKYQAELISSKVSSKDASLEYIGMENITSWTGKFISSETEVEGLASRFDKDDVLFGKLRPYLAKVYKAERSGICSTEFLVYRTRKDYDSSFLQFLMRCYSFVNLVDSSTYGSKMPRANSEFIGNQLIPVPPISEQTAIANFLDRKTTQIDRAISIKEKQIELLKERRQILIHNAVTRGLDPDVKMKDSGVEWIGEIPEHWEVFKVKNLFRLIIDPAPNNNKYQLLSLYTDIGVKPRAELEERGNKASTTDGYWLVKKDDIVVNKLLAWMGAIGISNYDGVTSPAYDILRASKKLSALFYHYLFRTPICISELRKHSRGIMDMRLRLYFDKFGDIMVPFPTNDEQLLIVKHIENLSSKIEIAISLKEKEIERLKEYKSTLINSAVTGKIKVS